VQNDLERTPSRREQYAAGVTWLVWLSQVLETSLAVFFRHGFGRRYLGGQALAVFLVVFVFAGCWPHNDPRPLMCFLGLYFVACVWARFGTASQIRRGIIQHSFYSGAPRLMRWPIFRRMKEATVKALIEPLSVVLSAAYLMPLNEPLGSYLLIAAVGQMISQGMAHSYEEQRLMNARDAYLEQRHLAERFREGGWR